MAQLQGKPGTYIDSVLDVKVKVTVEVSSDEIIDLSFALRVKVLEFV